MSWCSIIFTRVIKSRIEIEILEEITILQKKRIPEFRIDNQTAAYLEINDSIGTLYQTALSSLKDAKRKYLNLKKNHQKLRDEYANLAD